VKLKVVVPLAISPLVIAGVVWGHHQLLDSVHSYEEKYTICIEVKKSWLPTTYRLDFQSAMYQQMMKECQKEANG
jgi:hypothetical protein